ncbi:MAG: DNA-directed RNA polymerase subunit omega [Chloroflexi bacterium]|nr:DNA-directed RNA polymerase subunit omega [Chloroflexota bacterium]
MASVSLDGLLEKIPSRFNLVMVAAKRARQIKDGAPKLVTTQSVNPVTIAMEEIYDGKIVLEGSVARVLDELGRPLTGLNTKRADDLLILPEDTSDIGDARLDAIVNELFGASLGGDADEETDESSTTADDLTDDSADDTGDDAGDELGDIIGVGGDDDDTDISTE